MIERLERALGGAIRKVWTPALVEKFVGMYQGCYFTYAADPALRAEAASGGSITALLSYLLETGKIAGALVCRTKVMDGLVRPEFFIARSSNELKTSQGSKYLAQNFSSHALPLIREFKGKLAVIGLPCDIKILRNLWSKDSELQEKVVLMVSLFCGHNSEHFLTDSIVKRLQPQGKTLADFKHRVGHWRGDLRLTFSDGTSLVRPFSTFSDYQNLYFFAQRKCHYCNDHTGYNSDISAGDIWSLRMKNEAIKHTALITRNIQAENIVQEAVAQGWLTAQKEPIAEVCEGQARTMPFHHNLSARAKAGNLLGEKIKDTTAEKVRWNEFIAAYIVLFNERLSRTSFGKKLIFILPRPFLKLSLYLLKSLESV